MLLHISIRHIISLFMCFKLAIICAFIITCLVPNEISGKKKYNRDRNSGHHQCWVLGGVCRYPDVQYITKMHNYCTLLNCSVLYLTVLYCTELFGYALYCTVLYCTLFYCTVLFGSVLHCTVLYCTVLYCTVLYCSVLH